MAVLKTVTRHLKVINAHEPYGDVAKAARREHKSPDCRPHISAPTERDAVRAYAYFRSMLGEDTPHSVNLHRGDPSFSLTARYRPNKTVARVEVDYRAPWARNPAAPDDVLHLPDHEPCRLLAYFEDTAGEE